MGRGVLVVVALVVLATAVPAEAKTPRPLPRNCAGAQRVPESDGTGRTPVLFVHGFSGSPHNFRRSRDGRPDMIETIAALDGVTAYSFDYSKHATKWVTDPAIGPKLAHTIACLGRVSRHKVVAIAHSMGGLAVRYAQGQMIRGRPVADSLGRVVTIGTPARGVILLSFAGSDVGNAALQKLVDASAKVCDEHEKPRRHLCTLLDAAGAPAVTAMAPGSPELAALPPWAPGVAVHPMAANLRLRLSIFGIGTTVDLGDIVATVKSATADASPSQLPFVAGCATRLTDLVAVVDESPCSHTNELTNHRIVAAVLAQVKMAVAQTEPTAAGAPGAVRSRPRSATRATP